MGQRDILELDLHRFADVQLEGADPLLHRLGGGFVPGLRHTLTVVTPGFLHKLAKHSWPGNVREFQHAVMRCALLKDGAVIAGHGFAPDNETTLAPGHRDIARLRQIAEHALEEADGNKSKAAAKLKITRKTLYAWLRGDG